MYPTKCTGLRNRSLAIPENATQKEDVERTQKNTREEKEKETKKRYSSATMLRWKTGRVGTGNCEAKGERGREKGCR